MKKIILKTCAICIISLASACQGEKKVDSYSEDFISEEEQSRIDSPQSSSFRLNLKLGEGTYEANEVAVNEVQGGTEISKGNFAVIFYAKASQGTQNELQIQFNLMDFEFSPGKVNVKKSEVYQSDVVDEMDVVLTGKEVAMEITEITKVSSESVAGMTMTKYEFSGSFSGKYRSMGGKEIEIRNGSFENAHLSVTKYDQ
ncbi:hypothetical protein MM239_13555 [Belliella sp. DSM 111904]|uniref:YceI-like domain-containing protein n=1 Tax=Belliella filtrata TaxID=2923435 RepID=A0ABS9V242_9BACT|nr:hypothetical protein [Belliella filtrata]MCH7410428.1 hypothetical protein [Belliella filtrata]